MKFHKTSTKIIGYNEKKEKTMWKKMFAIFSLFIKKEFVCIWPLYFLRILPQSRFRKLATDFKIFRNIILYAVRRIIYILIIWNKYQTYPFNVYFPSYWDIQWKYFKNFNLFPICFLNLISLLKISVIHIEIRTIGMQIFF